MDLAVVSSAYVFVDTLTQRIYRFVSERFLSFVTVNSDTKSLLHKHNYYVIHTYTNYLFVLTKENDT